jgi:hypothetical protein
VSEEGIAPDVQAFIASHVESVGELEVLLLLYHSRPRAWKADDLARELRIDPAWAAEQLAQLCARGLLRCTDPPSNPSEYFYSSDSPALDAAVAGLDKAYADRRVAVIALIYSKPPDALRSFSDAFRFRKDKPGS